jgi:hypothetical protein
MKWTIALAALLLAGGGCLDTNGGGTGEAPLAISPTVVEGMGMITFSGPVAAVGSEALRFAVGSNVTLVYAEIEWEDEAQDIDLALASPSAGMTGNAQNFDHIAEGGSPGSPDSPHSLTVVAPEAGEWQASAFANGAAAAVEYRVVVTMFHGEASVPAGYSAL